MESTIMFQVDLVLAAVISASNLDISASNSARQLILVEDISMSVIL
jgi:hypothetical protein